jgi:hypothetical protein
MKLVVKINIACLSGIRSLGSPFGGGDLSRNAQAQDGITGQTRDDNRDGDQKWIVSTRLGILNALFPQKGKYC